MTQTTIEQDKIDFEARNNDRTSGTYRLVNLDLSKNVDGSYRNLYTARIWEAFCASSKHTRHRQDMKHKHAELLIAAAQNADTKFFAKGWGYGNCTIAEVLAYPNYDWQIHKQKFVHQYFQWDFEGNGNLFSCTPSDNWYIHIIDIDGVKTAEFKR